MQLEHKDSSPAATSKSQRRRAHRAERVARSRTLRGVALAGVTALVAASALGLWRWHPMAPLSTFGILAVHKSPSCSCCARWMERAQRHGFATSVHNENNLAELKRATSVPESLYSCHTTVVGDYVFEGHVPLDLVERVLRERPAIAGLAVAGMPQGAPGMEVGAEHYDVTAFTRSGETSLYARR
jgi:hypothetical protein